MLFVSFNACVNLNHTLGSDNVAQTVRIDGVLVYSGYDSLTGALTSSFTNKADLVFNSQRASMTVISGSKEWWFFDGTDTYWCVVTDEFLPGHKLDGDKDISYTCTIWPGERVPPFYAAPRLLWVVFCSGRYSREHNELPPVWNFHRDMKPATTFETSSDQLRTVIAADYEKTPIYSKDKTFLMQSISADILYLDKATILGKTLPRSFRYRVFVEVPPENEAKIVGEWTFEAKNITIVTPKELSYPKMKGTGSISDYRFTASTNEVAWLSDMSQVRRPGFAEGVQYRWSESDLPTRETPGIIEAIAGNRFPTRPIVIQVPTRPLAPFFWLFFAFLVSPAVVWMIRRTMQKQPSSTREP